LGSEEMQFGVEGSWEREKASIVRVRKNSIASI